jgi:hypothetical protein
MTIEFNIESDNKASFTISNKVLAEFKEELSKVLILSIKEQILNAVIPSLSPANFEGEAIQYMREHNIPITELGTPKTKDKPEVLGVSQYSKLIFKEFINNIDDLVVYDNKNKMIMLSPFITALEYGDLYRPVLKTITRAIESILISQE